ncbi:MAG: hypothetical protein M3P01_04590 [Actinomycetota bacterium]|nr:hypothetical protein [Actinomycetota bacterium]
MSDDVALMTGLPLSFEGRPSTSGRYRRRRLPSIARRRCSKARDLRHPFRSDRVLRYQYNALDGQRVPVERALFQQLNDRTDVAARSEIVVEKDRVS